MSRKHLVHELFIGMLLIGLSVAAHAAADPNVEYHYNINVELFSIQDGPQGPIKDSYCSLGSGSGQFGSGLGIHCGDYDDKEGFQFWVDINPVEEDDMFFVEVKIRPDTKTNPMKPKKERLAMSDLKPISLDLARDEKKKRSYKLNLTPSIKRIDQTKRQVEASTLKLDRWSFDQSDVIVDNWRYAGQIKASGFTIVVMDIPGYARIKFSLQPFPNAQPLGTMQDGQVVIQKPGGVNPQTVWIRDVKIGSPAITIPGGPYMVWVSWSPPSQTLIQAAQQMADYDPERSGQHINAVAKNQLHANQQALKEKIGKLKEADFAPDGVIPQVLWGVRMQCGGEFTIPAKIKN